MTDPTKGDPAVMDQENAPVKQDPEEGDGGKKAELPDNLKGKTPEELAQMVLEKESAYGRQSTEVGELRKQLREHQDQLNYMRGVEEIRRHEELKRQRDSELKERPEERKPEWNYEDPMGTVETVVRSEIGKEKAEIAKARMMDNVSRAREAFADGQKIMESEKELFEGIEDETRKAVFEYYAPYLEAGHDVERYMKDPKAWRVAAQHIRLNRGEVDRLAKHHEKFDTPPPTDQEIPGRPSGGSGPSIELDPEVKMIADQYGLSYEDAEEIIQEEAKLRGVR